MMVVVEGSEGGLVVRWSSWSSCVLGDGGSSIGRCS